MNGKVERHDPGTGGSVRSHTDARPAQAPRHHEQIVTTAMPSAKQEVARQMQKRVELWLRDLEELAVRIRIYLGAQRMLPKLLHSQDHGQGSICSGLRSTSLEARK